MTNPVGRPLKYKTVEELEEKIEKYFAERTKEDPPTITGLALELGFLDRKSIYEYKEKPQFTHTIKKARLRCEQYAEKILMSGAVSPAAPIFALKNYGWTDKHEIETTDKTDYAEQQRKIDEYRTQYEK